jgi:hypothetical protein
MRYHWQGKVTKPMQIKLKTVLRSFQDLKVFSKQYRCGSCFVVMDCMLDRSQLIVQPLYEY